MLGNVWMLVAIIVSGIAGQDCGPNGGKIAIAGSTTVEPIARKWVEEYTRQCPSIIVTVQGGGSSQGAARVCAAGNLTSVDIGTMSRKWRLSTAFNTNGEVSMTANPSEFQCFIGDKTRKTVQLDVALDGISVVLVAGGLAAQCMRKTQGLTLPQLRWIYSNATEVQMGLTTEALLREVIPNSDNNITSRLWREIFDQCPAANIRIAGPDAGSGTNEFFSEAIGMRPGENFNNMRPGGYVSSVRDEDIVQAVETSSQETYGDMIAYFGFSYYLGEGALLYGVPIKNSAGVFKAPTRPNIETDSYNPFSRRLYVQVLLTEASLTNTKPFLAWGLSNAGTFFTDSTGYVGLPLDYRISQLAKLGLPPPKDPIVTIPTVAPARPLSRSPVLAPHTLTAPTKVPTKLPTKVPTKLPTKVPTKVPTKLPTKLPTKPPTKLPSTLPTKLPTTQPVKLPTIAPLKPPKRCGRFGLFCKCIWTVLQVWFLSSSRWIVLGSPMLSVSDATRGLHWRQTAGNKRLDDLHCILYPHYSFPPFIRMKAGAKRTRTIVR